MVLKGAGFDRPVWQKGHLKRNKCREVAQETRGWPVLSLGQRTAKGVSCARAQDQTTRSLKGRPGSLALLHVSGQCVRF